MMQAGMRDPYLMAATNCMRLQAHQQHHFLIRQLQQELLMPTERPEFFSQPSHGPELSRAREDHRAPVAEAPRLATKVTPNPHTQQGSQSQAPRVQTLSTSLQTLSHEDPDCLFIVRRINKLGFKASRTLKQHYAAHGVVVRVLVAHSTVRQHGDPQCHVRRRPSSLGFVQMASTEAVRKILELGDEQ